MKETPQCVEDINEKRKRAKENHKVAQDFNTNRTRTTPQRAPDTKESLEPKRILRVREIPAKH